MITPELINYIKQCQARGLDREVIIKQLQDSGWEQGDINNAFGQLFRPPVPMPVPTPGYTAAKMLPGCTDLLKEAWIIYKSKLATLLGVWLFPVLLGIPLFILIIIGGVLLSLPNSQAIPEVVSIIIIAILVIIILIAVFVVAAWANIAVLYVISNRQEKISVVEVYKKTANKILSFWWVNFLVGAIVLGGALLFFIPGIIFSIWFSFAIYIMVAENIKGMNALLKSKEYVKDYWWAVLGRLLFWGLINFALSMAVIALPQGILIALGLKDLAKIYESLFGTIFSVLLAPFAITYVYLIYENLKKIKTGVVFTPNPSHRTGFIALAIIGPIAFSAIMIGIVLMMMQFLPFFMEAMKYNSTGSSSFYGPYGININGQLKNSITDEDIKKIQEQFNDALTNAAQKNSEEISPLNNTQLDADNASNASQSLGLTEADYDRLLSQQLNGLAGANILKTGPLALELTNFWGSNSKSPYIWLEVNLIPLPYLANKSVLVKIEDVKNQSGQNIYDSTSTFETNFFSNISLSKRSDPVEHYHGIRSVHLLPNSRESDINEVTGQIILKLPIEVTTLNLSQTNVGKEDKIGAATITLKKIDGDEITYVYDGPGDLLLGIEATGVNGQKLDSTWRYYPNTDANNQTLKQAFDGDIATLQLMVASRIIERTYPFAVKK